jgi:hypothetical protein
MTLPAPSTGCVQLPCEVKARTSFPCNASFRGGIRTGIAVLSKQSSCDNIRALVRWCHHLQQLQTCLSGSKRLGIHRLPRQMCQFCVCCPCQL